MLFKKMDAEAMQKKLATAMQAYLRMAVGQFLSWRRGKWTSCLHEWTFDDR